jgi:hypothetical protein
MPLLLYRYLSALDGLQVLQSAELKVGRMLKLNDPADCQPAIVTSPEILDNDAYAACAQKFLSTLHEEFGLVCYSAMIDDPVIWSHYADAHKGMALEFEFETPPLRVGYPPDNLRPQLDPSDPEIQGGSLWALTIGFRCKAKSWEYEREYREFIELTACRMEGAHYFCRPNGILRRAILGVRCDVTVSDARHALSNQWPDSVRKGVVVTRASLSRHSFHVDVAHY